MTVPVILFLHFKINATSSSHLKLVVGSLVEFVEYVLPGTFYRFKWLFSIVLLTDLDILTRELYTLVICIQLYPCVARASPRDKVPQK